MSRRVLLIFIAHVVAGIAFSVWSAVEGGVTAAKGLREVDERPPVQFLVTIWALCFVVTDLAAL
jgi:hypothetical protein